MNTDPKRIIVYVDADACPVKDEIYRVAQRYRLHVAVVANAPIAVPREPWIERVVVSEGPDVADDWIAGRAVRGDIVVTADIPLAARAVKAGATVLAPNGRLFDAGAIGLALATRNLMDDIRSAGGTTRGPNAFSARDRSAFLSAMDLAVVRLRRDGFLAG
ncbi:YaiI/YqxD family protein [Phreatobacter sp.]|uniref:YaiI/YqxD family protein n=1 Tax=Phreatobacter sp. TaxID=1966341 RepID=UPI003F6E4A26